MESMIKIPVADILNSELTDAEIGVKILIRCLAPKNENEYMRLDRVNFAKTLGVSIPTFKKAVERLKERGEVEVKEFNGDKFGKGATGYKVENIFQNIEYNDIQFRNLLDGIDQKLLDLYFGNKEVKEKLRYMGLNLERSCSEDLDFKSNIREKILFPKDQVIKLEYLDMLIGYYRVSKYESYGKIIKEDLKRAFTVYFKIIYDDILKNKESNLSDFRFAGKSFTNFIIAKAKKMENKQSPFAYMIKMIENLSFKKIRSYQFIKDWIKGYRSIVDKRPYLSINENYTYYRDVDLEPHTLRAFYGGILKHYSMDNLKEVISNIKVCSRRFLMVERTWIKYCIERGLNLSAIIDEIKLRAISMEKRRSEFNRGSEYIVRVIGKNENTISKNLSYLCDDGIIQRSKKDFGSRYTYILKNWEVDLTDGNLRSFESIKELSQRYSGLNKNLYTIPSEEVIYEEGVEKYEKSKFSEMNRIVNNRNLWLEYKKSKFAKIV